jgi:hypothetical protein
MSNFAFFVNHQLSAAPSDKMAELKEVFPKFFGKNQEPVYIRANENHFHKVKRGASSSRMKEEKRPNSPVSIVMRSQFKDPETLRINEVVVSSVAPEFNPLTNKANYKKNAYISVGDQTAIHDENVLYFLYFHGSKVLSNGVDGNVSAPFCFAMPEVESAAKLQNETRNAEFVVKVSKLSNDSVVEILAKYGLKPSETEEINKNTLISKFKQSNADVQGNLNMFADAILSSGGQEKKESADNVQAAVESAIESGVIKIEDNLVYLRKLGTEEYQKTPTLKLKHEGADERLLEIVMYFSENQDKLKYIK